MTRRHDSKDWKSRGKFKTRTVRSQYLASGGAKRAMMRCKQCSDLMQIRSWTFTKLVLTIPRLIQNHKISVSGWGQEEKEVGLEPGGQWGRGLTKLAGGGGSLEGWHMSRDMHGDRKSLTKQNQRFLWWVLLRSTRPKRPVARLQVTLDCQHKQGQEDTWPAEKQACNSVQTPTLPYCPQTTKE